MIIYIYVENKKNNSNAQELINTYYRIFNEDFIDINSNNSFLKTLYNSKVIINTNIDNYINKLNENINLLNNTYYDLYYLPTHDKFLEYPDEIIYKINQFKNELNHM